MSLRHLPDSPPPENRPLRTYRSAQIWTAARADYLAGGSAPEVCERHGLSLSTFRWRARNEGWRRADQPDSPIDAPFTDPEAPRMHDRANWMDFRDTEDADDSDAYGDQAGDLPPPVDNSRHFYRHPPRQDPEPEPDETPLPAADLCERAWLNAQRAIRLGRMIEARGWVRIHRDLAEIARNLDTDRINRHHRTISRNLADLKQTIGALRSAAPDN